MKRKTMLATIVITVLILVVVHFTVKRELQFEDQILIEQPINDVWEVLGNQFTQPHLWAVNFKTSEPGGEPKLSGLTYLHRATTTENGVNWQELDSFDPQHYRLTYHISNGIPPIASKALGDWSLEKVTDSETQMTVHFTLETTGLLGLIMSPIVSKKIGASSTELVEEFKYYLENGKPHPRKVEDIKNQSNTQS
jgi:hypothetical protein